jgi:L-ascorbate metabolism protein UlaG (beta-lactamase superfamily)
MPVFAPSASQEADMERATRRREVLAVGAMLTVALALAMPHWPQAQPAGKAELLWLGQAAWRITTPGGKVIVIDPWLTENPKTPADYKDLTKLGKVDLILLTHGHSDHVGDVKALAAATGAKVYGAAGLIETLIDLGWVSPEQGVRFGKGGKVQPLGPQITITQTRAEHSSEVTITDPATKKSTTHPGGEPAGFIIELENGFKIYHMGDTGLFGDMKLIAEYYRPDLILMPIGGHFVMDPKDAAYATKELLKPKFVIPMHYGTTPVLKGTPEEYLAALGPTTTKVFVLNPGDKIDF